MKGIARFIDRHGLLAFSLFSALYFPGALGDALRKPFWFDELFSWHIAGLADFGAIVRALSEGIDPNPPLSYALILISHRLLGSTSELATRLPSIVAFWLALLFLFLLMRRRAGALFGCVAVLFVSLTKAFAFAAEARPYAMVLACCAASLYFWTSAAEDSHRRASLIGLFASLSLGLLSHLYAVLLFLPLAGGEAYRSFQSRRIDWPVWGCLAAASAALLPSVPMMTKFTAYSASFWSRPTWANLASALQVFYCNPLTVCLLAAACLFGLASAGGPFVRRARSRSPRARTPSHELAALAILILLPLAGFIMARLFTNAYYYRYFLPSILGIGAAFALMYHRLLCGRAVGAGLLLTVLAVPFLAEQGWRVEQAIFHSPVQEEPRRVASKLAVEGQEPIIVNHRLDFLEYLHYAPAGTRDRLRFLVDLDAASRAAGEDTSDRALAGLKTKVAIPVEDYLGFVSSHDRFWIAGTDTWLIGRLLKDGASLRLDKRPGCLFIHVSFSGVQRAPWRSGTRDDCKDDSSELQEVGYDRRTGKDGPR